MKSDLKKYAVLMGIAVLYALFVNLPFNCGKSYRVNDGKLEFVPDTILVDTAYIGEDGATYRTGKQWMSFSVNVKRQDLRGPLVHSESLGKDSYMQIERVSIVLDESRFAGYMIWKYAFNVLFIVFWGIVIWVVFLVYKLVRNVSSGDVFVSSFAKYLKLLGKFMVTYFIIVEILGYAFIAYVKSHFSMAYYEMEYPAANVMWLVMGLALLIISEIITIGKGMKDEQDLTI